MSEANYAMEASNTTIVQLLVKHATVATPEPFLMYLTDNTTLWPRSDWPAGGLAIKRPVYMVGWYDIPTALDFGMGAGRARLEGRWANLTLDSLVLENLGYGDPDDASGASYSAVAATNMWFFNTTRCGGRSDRGGGGFFG
jgi:hypothetical protein